MGIGLGPSRFIKDFDNFLNSLNLEYDKKSPMGSYNVYTWALIDEKFGRLKDKTVFLFLPKDRSGKIGWFFRPFENRYFDSPNLIIEFILDEIRNKDNTEIN